MVSAVSYKSLVQSKPCKMCPQATNISACARCGMAFYCSEKCQSKDWKEHKKVCKLMVANAESFNPPHFDSKISMGYGVMDQPTFNRLSYTAVLECAALVERRVAFAFIDRQLGRWRREIAEMQKSEESQDFGLDRRETTLDFLRTAVDQNCKYRQSALKLQGVVENYLRQMGDRTELSVVKGVCEVTVKIYTGTLIKQVFEEFEKNRPQEGPRKMILDTVDAIGELACLRLSEEGVGKFDGGKLQISDEEYYKYLCANHYLSIQVQYQIDLATKVYLTNYVTDIFKEGSQSTLHRTRPVINLVHPATFNLAKIDQETARLWDETHLKKDPEYLIPLSFLYLHGSPKVRGTAWCAQVMVKAAMHHLNLPILPFAKDVDWGMKTLEYFFLEDYARDYPGFFVTK